MRSGTYIMPTASTRLAGCSDLAKTRPEGFLRRNQWFERSRRPRHCSLCSGTFRVTDFPDWIYFGSNGCVTCCFQCPILELPRKSDLPYLIRDFVESCGFIPTSASSPINHAFTSRIPSDHWSEVIGRYAKMGGIDYVKNKYGSWFKALAESHALPDGVLATPRGIRCMAQDGHTCHSLDEQRIDDWLTSHGLAHDREPLYPPHPILNRQGRRRADWQVQDTVIEYFGLIRDQMI